MIHDRVFPWLRRLSDRLRYRSQSVQYELQRMTPKGGWRNFYTDPEGRHADAFPTPPPQPSFGSDTGYPPGTYRCLRRVDGRIESILWTVESPDADEFYAEWREDAAAETEPTDATATDGGSATDSGAGDATVDTSTTADSDTDDDLSPLVQELMADARQGSTASLLALSVHEFFTDRNDSSSDDDDT